MCLCSPVCLVCVPCCTAMFGCVPYRDAWLCAWLLRLLGCVPYTCTWDARQEAQTPQVSTVSLLCGPEICIPGAVQLLWDLLRWLGVQGTMLGAMLSLYDGCLLSMRVNRVSQTGTPSMGLRQGCPLSTTLFGLFVDGLHHYLETAVSNQT